MRTYNTYLYNEPNAIGNTSAKDYWEERCDLLGPLGPFLGPLGRSWELLGEIEYACGGNIGRSPSLGDHLSGRQTRKHVRRCRGPKACGTFLDVLGNTWRLLSQALGRRGSTASLHVVSAWRFCMTFCTWRVYIETGGHFKWRKQHLKTNLARLREVFERPWGTFLLILY